VAVRSMELVCDLSLAGVVDSNTTGGKNVCLL